MSKPIATSGQISMEAVVGRNIRALRQARNQTVEGLAAACGLTKGQMSKIETGNASAPLSTIERIAQALEADPGLLLRRRDASNWYLARRSELEARRKRIRSTRAYYELLFPGGSFESTFQAMHCRVESSDQFTLFRYPGAVLISVMRGEIIYTYGDERIPLAPGDVFYCDGAEPHGPVKLIQAPADYLLILGNLRV
jgi:transcriptional regulator with XRE-family HTH domain